MENIMTQLMQMSTTFCAGDAADENVKGLDLVFHGRGEVKGHIFTQIKMSNFAYIYEVYDGNDRRWYEVFKRIVDKRFNKIAYPKSKSFGLTAWTCRTLSAAEYKFELLSKVSVMAIMNKK